MQFTPIEKIIIPSRQRAEINNTKLSELKADILSHGLLHPIILASDFSLIAGGRRLQAISELAKENQSITYAGKPVPLGSIPAARFTSELAELQREEIELNENLLRENLSWQDETRALAKIHALRKSQNPEQTFTETSKEIVTKTSSLQSPKALADKISRATVTEQFLDREEVKNASDERRAFNAAMQIARNEFAGELAKRKSLPASRHKLLPGDAREVLPSLTEFSPSFRCFILDPPYGMGAHNFGNAAMGTHDYDDSKEYAVTLTYSLIEHCTSLASSDAHIWIFCDIANFLIYRKILADFNWLPFRTPLVWNSGTSGHIPNQKTAIRRNYELILFASRSSRGLNYILDDVIRITAKSAEEHAAQKPVELYELFLKLSCNPGDFVLDPTCGNGTIFLAADNQKMTAFGIELSQQYIANCQALLIELARKGKK